MNDICSSQRGPFFFQNCAMLLQYHWKELYHRRESTYFEDFQKQQKLKRRTHARRRENIVSKKEYSTNIGKSNTSYWFVGHILLQHNIKRKTLWTSTTCSTILLMNAECSRIILLLAHSPVMRGFLFCLDMNDQTSVKFTFSNVSYFISQSQF